MRRIGIALAVVLATATPASAWLVPEAPAAQWRAEGYGSLIDMVVGENVTQVWSLDGFRALPPQPAGQIVMYDLEGGFSPPEDLTSPKVSMREFVKEAHTAGYTAMLAPSRSVVTFEQNACTRKGRSESVNVAFLRCGYASIPTDYLLLQAQRLECNPAGYAAFVKAATQKVQGTLIAELTVGWSDSTCLTIQSVIDSYDAAKPYAEHFALWGSRLDAAPLFEHVIAEGENA